MHLLPQLLPRESLHLERLGVLLHCFYRFLAARGCGSGARFSILNLLLREISFGGLEVQTSVRLNRNFSSFSESRNLYKIDQ